MTENIAVASKDTQREALQTPSDLPAKDRAAVAEKINGLVADAYVLYAKTKNFHWHISGPNFRDFHRLLDEQGEQILETIDPLAERVRKLGQPTVKSLGQMLELTSLEESDAEFVSPYDMLVELMNDNMSCAKSMRDANKFCDDHDDVATASLLEQFIDETEKRVWFLFESAQAAGEGGH